MTYNNDVARFVISLIIIGGAGAAVLTHPGLSTQGLALIGVVLGYWFGRNGDKGRPVSR